MTAIHLLQQRSILSAQLKCTHILVLQFMEDFEAIYYCRKVSCLHFCRQSVYGLSHLAPDVACLGPGIYSSQWTLEQTIGNLGQEIKQLSNPYANLANCGLQCSQFSALHAIIPGLAPDTLGLPQGAVNLRDRYVLRRACDKTCVTLYRECAVCSGKSPRYDKPSLKVSELSRMCQLLVQGGDKSHQTTQSHWRVLQAYVLYSRTKRGDRSEE